MAKQFQTRMKMAVNKTPHKQKLMGMPGGNAGVAFTLSLMSRLVKEYKVSPKIRNVALTLVARLPQKDYKGEVNALFDFVKYHIRYVRDIHGVETIQTPEKTLEFAAGDCDDKSTLLAALLESLGHPTRFRAMGFTRGYCHVIVETQLDQRWVSLDTTEPQPMGWLPPRINRNMYQDNFEQGLGYTPDGYDDNRLGWITAVIGLTKTAVDMRKAKKAKKKMKKQIKRENAMIAAEEAKLTPVQVKPAVTATSLPDKVSAAVKSNPLPWLIGGGITLGAILLMVNRRA